MKLTWEDIIRSKKIIKKNGFVIKEIYHEKGPKDPMYGSFNICKKNISILLQILVKVE